MSDKELYFQECWKKGKPYLLTACAMSPNAVKRYGFKFCAKGAYHFIEKPRTEEGLERFQEMLKGDDTLGVESVIIAPYTDENEFGWEPKNNYVLGMRELQVRNMADTLIRAHHRHLLPANIGYFKINKQVPKGKGGTRKLAFVKRVDSTLQYFSNLDFAIFFYADAWDVMSREQRVALLDHELCHCSIKDGSWCLVEHDFEEFRAIVDRYGDGFFEDAVEALESFEDDQKEE